MVYTVWLWKSRILGVAWVNGLLMKTSRFFGSSGAYEWWASKRSRWKLMLNWWVHGSGTEWWRLFFFFSFFCGARCGQLDIEKQHLDFFGDSCTKEGYHFENIAIKNQNFFFLGKDNHQQDHAQAAYTFHREPHVATIHWKEAHKSINQ